MKRREDRIEPGISVSEILPSDVREMSQSVIVVSVHMTAVVYGGSADTNLAASCCALNPIIPLPSLWNEWSFTVTVVEM